MLRSRCLVFFALLMIVCREAWLSSRSTSVRRIMDIRKAPHSNVINAVCVDVTHLQPTIAEWPDLRPGRDVSACPKKGRNLVVAQFQVMSGLPCHAVRSQAVAPADRSKGSPVFSIVCMMTASLRATATAARLKPTFFLSFSPQVRSVLSARVLVRITTAA